MTIDTLKEGQRQGLLDIHVESFLNRLRADGYAERTLRKKRSVARAFGRWTRCEHIAVDDLSDSHIAAFVERSPRRPKARVQFERAALQPLLEHLRVEARMPILLLESDTTPADKLTRDYIDYLRKDRGLAENSILVYVPFIRDLITDQVARDDSVCPGAFDAQTIRSFLLDRIHNRSSEYSRLLARSFKSQPGPSATL